MSVERLRERYLWWRDLTRMHATTAAGSPARCRLCQSLGLEMDAASIRLDMAVAADLDARQRAAVAWA